MSPRLPLAFIAVVLALPLSLSACEGSGAQDAPPTAGPPHVQAATPEAAGRYLVVTGGCNDCHTPGYMERGTAVPEAEWLMGMPVGFRGPWGTSYPKNLRLTAQAMTEDGWVERLHGQGLPPMPWVNVNALSEPDARAIYRYLRALGPAGAPAPDPAPPGVEPTTPYFDFVPQHLERMPAPPSAVASALPPPSAR